nr:immunoglobulin heavy chain junction region [Macaca mulatta]MOX15248.1 immunoglobulin heavy chain junction region [Macaca mulatta]
CVRGGYNIWTAYFSYAFDSW